MWGLFASLPKPYKKLNEPSTEGWCNRLHYRVTVIFFLGCSILVTCLEWVGNGSKISCVMEGPVDSWTIPQNVINTYCFVLKTFTLPKHWNSKVGYESAHRGVGDFVPGRGEENPGDDVTYQAYYQWVPFVLFFQACLFYLPHLLSKAWEGGKIRNIISGLNQLILVKEERKKNEQVLANYIVESLHTHNFWAMKMLFIEFINLINAIGQIYFINVFLGGEFSTYGVSALGFLEADPEKRIDPMAIIFPRVTKCSFFKYGPSGTVQTHDAICVLPINIINEKIYVFLWFWLVFLSILTILSVIYHMLVLVTPSMTRMMLRNRSMNQSDLPFEEMGKRFELGDWKLLSILSRNMEPLVFGEFIRELYEAMKNLERYDANDNASRQSLIKSKA